MRKTTTTDWRKALLLPEPTLEILCQPCPDADVTTVVTKPPLDVTFEVDDETTWAEPAPARAELQDGESWPRALPVLEPAAGRASDRSPHGPGASVWA